MKKTLICLLLIIAVMCQGCVTEKKNVNSFSETILDNNDGILISEKNNENTTTAENIDDATSETVNEIVPKALFDPANHSYKEVPSVTDAVTLVQTEIFDESYEYIYVVNIPKINSDKEGAKAFNEKLYSEYKDLLDIEKYKSEGNLHKITYTYSDYDGIIVIHFNEQYGLYQSEGAGCGTTFYYDSISDKELTKEEYLAHFSIDEKTLIWMSMWSLGDAEWTKMKYGRSLTASEESDFVYEPEYGKLWFSRPDNNSEPEGFAVNDKTVSVYYNVSAYTGFEQIVEIDVEKGLPCHPNFLISTQPTGVYESDAEGLCVTYKDGRIVSALVSEGIPVDEITITNSSIQIISDREYRRFTFDSYVEVNGMETNGGGSAGLYGADKVCNIYYFPRVEYTDTLVIKVINE